MNFWPFNKLEKRDSSYTDVLVQTILASANANPSALPTATGALEAAAGLISRSFAACEVSGSKVYTAALTPAFMAMVGRALIVRGELVAVVDVVGGRVRVHPAQDYDITGGYSDWVYRLTLPGPSTTTTRENVPASKVLHFRYGADPETPWKGIGPLQAAFQAGRLSANVVQLLADEAQGPRGHLLPMPRVDGADTTVTGLKHDLDTLGGHLAIVEDAADQYGTDRAAGGALNWATRRLGANPPAALVDLHVQATREIWAACGLSAALWDAQAASAARESWRQALFGTIAPLGRIVESELQAKIDKSVTLAWRELRAADITGRARALQSMVGAGIDLETARRLAGLSE